jgi:TonB-linked SusC/RagA family outer membrane protein
MQMKQLQKKWQFYAYVILLLILTQVSLQAQTRQISGTITSAEDNSPMPGVAVLAKGTNVGSITDENGKYSINLPSGSTVLIFSFVGFEPQEITVGTESTIDVKLATSINLLTDIVVVGYGTQERKSVTGAISTVSNKEITALPVISVESALQGRIASVSVVNNGSPGDSPIVRIRGIGSIGYASNPLYVIDGFPTSDLNSFDSRDIESVEVLKDASSAAIYGSRAANGVIMITTKKGNREGKLRVNVDSYYGVQQAWRKLDLLNRDEYIRYGTALKNNAGAPLPDRFSNMNTPIYAGATQTYAQTDTDWQDAVFRKAAITQHSINLTGGNDKSRFYSSVGYFKQEGIMLGTDYQRVNFRINSEHNISKRFNFGQNLYFAYDDQQQENNAGGRTQIKHTLHMTPYIPIYDPTLIGGYRGPNGADGSDPQNPVRTALQDLNLTDRFKLLTSAYAEARIFDFLTYRFVVGIDFVAGRSRTNYPIFNESFNARANHEFSERRYNYMSSLFSNVLTFDKSFGKHNINAVAVGEQQLGTYTELAGSGNSSSNSINQMTGLTSPSTNGIRTENAIISFVGRVNYDFNDKYLFGASFRRDGSSKFAPGKKWGNFYSVSAGWRISEEAFIKDNLPQISELKVRASYGTLGFAGIGDYAFQSLINQNTTAIFGGTKTPGAFFNTLGNTDLGWEITKMRNIGLDLGLWKNNLTFSFEYYHRVTDDLILQAPIAPSLGYTNPPIVNVGSMKNWGYEFQLGYNKQINDFTFNVSGNLGITRNQVLSLGGAASSALFSGASTDYGGFDITRTITGSPIQSFFGWKTDGIFQNQQEVAESAQPNAKPGDIRFVDVNDDGAIDANDRVELGSFLPKFNYGLNLGANYKGFDLNIFIQGVQGNKIFNGTKVLTQGMLRLFNASKDVLNAWTPQNTNTDIPRAVDGDPSGNARTSNRFIEDGSYLRIKNFSIGYNLPKKTLDAWTKGTLSRARIYFSSQNLLTLTKYTGYDPEIGSRLNTGTLTNGIDYGQFPQARTLMLGLQLGF